MLRRNEIRLNFKISLNSKLNIKTITTGKANIKMLGFVRNIKENQTADANVFLL